LKIERKVKLRELKVEEEGRRRERRRKGEGG
jgi:hypothetical protein